MIVNFRFTEIAILFAYYQGHQFGSLRTFPEVVNTLKSIQLQMRPTTIARTGDAFPNPNTILANPPSKPADARVL